MDLLWGADDLDLVGSDQIQGAGRIVPMAVAEVVVDRAVAVLTVPLQFELFAESVEELLNAVDGHGLSAPQSVKWASR
jgi:hypothetical protein